MPNNYVAKKVPVNRDQIKACLEHMRSHSLSLNAAAILFQLPETTVRRHNNYQQREVELPPVGRLPCIPSGVQVEVAQIARIAAAHGFGLSREELRKLIGDYVKENIQKDTSLGNYLRENCQFANNMPSDKWLANFMCNHHLSLHKPSPLERARRNTQSDPFIVYGFFDILDELFLRLNLHNAPSRIYNLDETAFFLDPKGGRVVAEVGESTHRVTAGPGRACFTALACVSATGHSLPPLIVFDTKI